MKTFIVDYEYRVKAVNDVEAQERTLLYIYNSDYRNACKASSDPVVKEEITIRQATESDGWEIAL